MIANCMPHQLPDAAPVARAAVIRLEGRQWRRTAGGIMADCPGWHVWFSERAAQWIAHRCGGPDCGNSSGPALVSVTAADSEALRVAIFERSLSELAVDHPEWETACTDDGFWWASPAGADDGRRTGAICATSPVKLAIAVRAYAGLMARQPPLYPVDGDGSRC